MFIFPNDFRFPRDYVVRNENRIRGKFIFRVEVYGEVKMDDDVDEVRKWVGARMKMMMIMYDSRRDDEDDDGVGTKAREMKGGNGREEEGLFRQF